MAGLTFVGDDDTTLNVTVDTLDQNHSKFNFATYGQPFGKTCYVMIPFILCALFCALHIDYIPFIAFTIQTSNQ